MMELKLTASRLDPSRDHPLPPRSCNVHLALLSTSINQRRVRDDIGLNTVVEHAAEGVLCACWVTLLCVRVDHDVVGDRVRLDALPLQIKVPLLPPPRVPR